MKVDSASSGLNLTSSALPATRPVTVPVRASSSLISRVTAYSSSESSYNSSGNSSGNSSLASSPEDRFYLSARVHEHASHLAGSLAVYAAEREAANGGGLDRGVVLVVEKDNWNFSNLSETVGRDVFHKFRREEHHGNKQWWKL